MLRKIRITLAAIMFVAINLLFLGIGWGATQWLAYAAKIQFLPALMALNYGVLAVLVVLTLIFGRIYCSVICPLGIMQDIFGWTGKRAKKNRYLHSKEKRMLRYSVFTIFVVCLVVGFAPVTTLLAPYSAYGRIVNSLFRPLYDLLLNGLAAIESHYDSYLLSSAEIWMRSVTTFVVALLTLVVLGALAWRNGRTYCNTICPVGTTLSLFSRFSLLRIKMDKSKCKNCSLCERNCKTSAIDYKAGTVDYTRCVVCGDCVAKCKFDALHYGVVESRKRKVESRKSKVESGKSKVESVKSKVESVKSKVESAPDMGKRAFIGGVALASGTAMMAQAKIKVDGGLAVIEDKKVPKRDVEPTPPGSISTYNMSRHCTACQLCVSACPNNVLRPSTNPMHFMQPIMSFERGYCRPECTRCSEVCPTGAIHTITKEKKTAIHTGHAVWIESNCIPVANGDSCGNCARHCPVWAIQMVEKEINGKTLAVPQVDAERCIGCGKCEYLCPARPFSAIYVEGNTTHHVD